MKKSLQFQRTTRDIVKATWKLLEEENFNRITVKQILNEAMISRSTFYQHFSDKYAIIEYIENEYLDQYTNLLNKLGSLDESSYVEIKKDFKNFFIRENKQLQILLKIDDTDLNLGIRFKETAKVLIEKENNSEFGELETDMWAGHISEYFVYYINHPNQLETMGVDTFNALVNIILKTFGMKINKTNHDKMIKIILNAMSEISSERK